MGHQALARWFLEDILPRGSQAKRFSGNSPSVSFDSSLFEGRSLFYFEKLLHIFKWSGDAFKFCRIGSAIQDAQQAILISRMVADLTFPVTIEIAPIVREADGLALSSRNMYLGPAERRAAVALSAGLESAHQAFGNGERSPAALLRRVREVVNGHPAVALEYVEAVDPRTLQPVATAGPDTLLAVAAQVGPARLIDNIVLGEGLAADERLPGVAP